MKKNELPMIAKTALSDVLHKSGSILYSSHETLKPGVVYLMGFNPGGTGGHSIKRSIDSMLTNTANSYLDESWKNRSGVWECGQAPLQKRVQWILSSLQLNPREVCASNLIFLQSRQANDIGFSLAEICWPVHEALLDIVRPKLILTFGNSDTSPYGYMHSIFGGKEDYLPSGHGNWSIKGFSCNINDSPIYVAGLPHLSRYNPIGRSEIIEWLSRKI